MIPESVHLNIGSLLFENLDQIDLTGPFEVLSRLPNATHRIYAKSIAPVRDVMGLRIMPDATLAEAPQLGRQPRRKPEDDISPQGQGERGHRC